MEFIIKMEAETNGLPHGVLVFCVVDFKLMSMMKLTGHDDQVDRTCRPTSDPRWSIMMAHVDDMMIGHDDRS